MLWGQPLPDHVARPEVMRPLLERALQANPESAELHAKLGYLHLDRKAYGDAARSFENALKLGSEAPRLRSLLARCYNYLHRQQDALEVLVPVEQASFERGRALMAGGDDEAAEREFRAVLADNPDDPGACRMLSRLLRQAGRLSELVAVCEALVARGATNAQLLYNWGWALALVGEHDKARRLLGDWDRIALNDLSTPAGFSSMTSFNQDLADEILSNPNKVSDFPQEDEANRGSRRVDDLFSGRRPDLIGTLLTSIQDAVAAYRPPEREGCDPWARARPSAARLRPWGLIQREGEYEEGHIHPGGWLSGVYYVSVPEIVSRSSQGAGCIEFGPPSSLAESQPGLVPKRRYVPREGMLLLAPSHYQHRTIPSGVDEYRISVAFDVVPDDQINIRAADALV